MLLGIEPRALCTLGTTLSLPLCDVAGDKLFVLVLICLMPTAQKVPVMMPVILESMLGKARKEAEGKDASRMK